MNRSGIKMSSVIQLRSSFQEPEEEESEKGMFGLKLVWIDNVFRLHRFSEGGGLLPHFAPCFWASAPTHCSSLIKDRPQNHHIKHFHWMSSTTAASNVGSELAGSLQAYSIKCIINRTCFRKSVIVLQLLNRKGRFSNSQGLVSAILHSRSRVTASTVVLSYRH